MGKKKRAAVQSQQPCGVVWCVAFARTEGKFCAVHGDRGERFHPVVGAPEVVGDCDWCNGDGECSNCEGSGDCQCHCGDYHDCHDCQGSGKCALCHGSGYDDGKPTAVYGKDVNEKDYIAWAFSVMEPQRGGAFDRPWE